DERGREDRTHEPHRLRDHVGERQLRPVEAFVPGAAAHLVHLVCHAMPPLLACAEPYAAAVVPVQPAAGRSNQTCTCPVPTEASYSLNSSPGAAQAAPPNAPAMIR